MVRKQNPSNITPDWVAAPSPVRCWLSLFCANRMQYFRKQWWCKYCCQGGASLSCSASISHILRGSRKWSISLLQRELIKLSPAMFGLTAAVWAMGVSNLFQKAGISEYLNFAVIFPSFFTLATEKALLGSFRAAGVQLKVHWKWCLIHCFLKTQVHLVA